MNDKSRVILEALEACGNDGCGVITLSLKTGYSQSVLRSFFHKHKKYCEPIHGKTKFKLNRLTDECGSVDAMVIAIEHKRVNERISAAFGKGLLLGLFIANIDVIVRLVL